MVSFSSAATLIYILNNLCSAFWSYPFQIWNRCYVLVYFKYKIKILFANSSMDAIVHKTRFLSRYFIRIITICFIYSSSIVLCNCTLQNFCHPWLIYRICYHFCICMFRHVSVRIAYIYIMYLTLIHDYLANYQ